MNQFDLLKSHIDAYTKKDGSVVRAHDDKRTAKQQFKRASGHARLVRRAEEGWDPEEGAIVNVRGDGNLSRIEYDGDHPDYKIEMAAERAINHLKDKLPSRFGTVLDAQKDRRTPDLFDLFGSRPDAKDFYQNARNVPEWFDRKKPTIEQIESGIPGMTNSGLRFVGEGLVMDSIYLSDEAQSSEYERVAKKMRDEIRRRYLSNPSVLKKSS